jgi:hypothetical protein
MGEGKGGGEKEGLSPLPSIPSRQERGGFGERGDVTSLDGGRKVIYQLSSLFLFQL